MPRVDPMLGGLAMIAGALTAFFMLSPKQDMSAAADRSKPPAGPKDNAVRRSSSTASRRRNATSRINYNNYMKDYMRKRRAAARAAASS